MSLFTRGLILGFAIAAAVGPMAILCIRRTLTHGRTWGLMTGLGIATGDSVYALVAALGLTFISGILIEQRHWLELTGGLFLLYLGIRSIRSTPASDVPSGARPATGLMAAYGSAFALTLTNPMTIVSFSALFAGLGMNSAVSYAAGAVLVSGVFLGSIAWWLALTLTMTALRDRMNEPVFKWINMISGGAIAGFGVLAVFSAVT